MAGNENAYLQIGAPSFIILSASFGAAFRPCRVCCDKGAVLCTLEQLAMIDGQAAGTLQHGVLFC